MPISMPSTIVCIDCGMTYAMAEPERVKFEQLLNSVSGFQIPRRCAGCRKLKREDKIRQERMLQSRSIPTYPPPPLPPAVPVPMPEAVTPAPKEEVRLILATKDFEDLVHGRPIVWQGVRVILADIGFRVMRQAIDRAELELELERAKEAIRNNGH